VVGEKRKKRHTRDKHEREVAHNCLGKCTECNRHLKWLLRKQQKQQQQTAPTIQPIEVDADIGGESDFYLETEEVTTNISERELLNSETTTDDTFLDIEKPFSSNDTKKATNMMASQMEHEVLCCGIDSTKGLSPLATIFKWILLPLHFILSCFSSLTELRNLLEQSIASFVVTSNVWDAGSPDGINRRAPEVTNGKESNVQFDYRWRRCFREAFDLYFENYNISAAIEHANRVSDFIFKSSGCIVNRHDNKYSYRYLRSESDQTLYRTWLEQEH